jgi:hypothetical protein
MIHPHDLWLRPIPWWFGPAAWMLRTRLLISPLTDLAYLHSITVVALMGRHELDAAVAVLMVVPVRK